MTGEPTPGVRISGVVVAFNEEEHLDECLDALGFCDELVVVDLGSTDRSKEVALRHEARVLDHAHVPAVELVRRYAVSHAAGDWIVFMDPDMTFPSALVPHVLELTRQPDLGAIYVPYRNYFCGRPVRHGRWGGTVRYPALFRPEAMDLLPAAHRGFELKPGHRSAALGSSEDEMIVHHWIASRADLEARIVRYAPLEAEIRAAAGERVRTLDLVARPVRSFLESYFLKLGILDGRDGLYLSWVSARLTAAFDRALAGRTARTALAAQRP